MKSSAKTFYLFLSVACFLLPFNALSGQGVHKLSVWNYTPATGSYGEGFKPRKAKLQHFIIESDAHKAALVAELVNALVENGVAVNVDNNAKDPDFELIFVEMQFSYPWYIENSNSAENIKYVKPEINPPLSAIESSVESKNFSTPWLRATLQYDGEALISGRFILPIAEFARVRDLYYAAKGNWGDVLKQRPYKLEGYAFPYTGVYRNIFIREFVSHQSNVPQHQEVTNELVHQVFAPHGETGVIVGSMYAMAETTVLGGSVRINLPIKRCLEQAKPFYLELYKHLFATVASNAPHDDENERVPFLPTDEDMEQISAVSGSYNCYEK